MGGLHRQSVFPSGRGFLPDRLEGEKRTFSISVLSVHVVEEELLMLSLLVIEVNIAILEADRGGAASHDGERGGQMSQVDIHQ